MCRLTWWCCFSLRNSGNDPSLRVTCRYSISQTDVGRALLPKLCFLKSAPSCSGWSTLWRDWLHALAPQQQLPWQEIRCGVEAFVDLGGSSVIRCGPGLVLSAQHLTLRGSLPHLHQEGSNSERNYWSTCDFLIFVTFQKYSSTRHVTPAQTDVLQNKCMSSNPVVSCDTALWWRDTHTILRAHGRRDFGSVLSEMRYCIRITNIR